MSAARLPIETKRSRQYAPGVTSTARLPLCLILCARRKVRAMGETEKDDEVAAEHWDDDGGRASAREKKERQDRWDEATGAHWHGYSPTAETLARRDVEVDGEQE